MKKSFQWIIVIAVSVVIYLTFPRGLFYTENDAIQISSHNFEKVCVAENIAPSLYEGPNKVLVGGARWAFEWRLKNKQSNARWSLIGVWIGTFGDEHEYLEQNTEMRPR